MITGCGITRSAVCASAISVLPQHMEDIFASLLLVDAVSDIDGGPIYHDSARKPVVSGALRLRFSFASIDYDF